ncbi:hypothetical protein BX666DRAFT_1973864 [Dichotomocladium elegans]|nr:hypothetical protein BX666DRAFT_1973864 [Dichotomocladium elegans]
MTSYGSRSQALTGEQSDLKKIKQKYSSQLSSLRELFADWSDDDLLFVLKEVEGDLYLAIDRISEGHATQWGEVKSKKSKKEGAQKAKTSTTPAPSTVPQTTTSYRSERPPPARGNNDRSRRGGRGGHNSRAHKQSNVQAPVATTWGASAPTKSSQSASDGGSWAAIASSKMNDSSWNTTADNTATNSNTATTTTNGGWDDATNNNTTSNTSSNGWDTKESEPTAEKPAFEPTSTASTAAPETKTWASLLKTQPKPEPEPAKKEEQEQEQTTTETTTAAIGTGWDASSNDGWNTKDAWNTTNDKPADEHFRDTPPATEEATDAWTSVEQEIPKSPVAERSPKESKSAITLTPKSTPAAAIQSPKDEPIAPVKKTNTRRLKQDAPVVLPNTGASLSSIGVKFGSLTLEETTAETTEITQTTLPPEPSVQDGIKQEAQAQTERLDGLSTLQNQTQQQPQQAAQEVIPQQPQQTPIQQQHQQQQLFGLDPLASGYSSYLPNQPPAGVSGFGVSPMGSLPDYNLYGVDAQRAAMLQGYYDPTAYNQSPSTNAYQSRDKHNQDGVGSLPQHTGAHTPGTAAQQMYPVNMPYYQYYYMPNQFTYQQAAYGQPYMNKNMYPNMYQQTGKPNTGSATSPYGAAGSPYSQNMYGQSVSSGYDDMSGLQQHLGGMGLHDYQKPYQQLPNFLGAAASGSQQSQQTQQPGASGSQQNAGKNDKSGAPAPGATTSNGHHHPQQQPQGYQHPAATGNYFNHSFQYQQQYPQHQQQYPHFQHQAAQQQQTPSGQPSPMGRQQPYWSQ